MQGIDELHRRSIPCRAGSSPAAGLTEATVTWLLRPVFEREAIRLREILLAQRDVSPLLNLGSSDALYREQTKPHIERELFAPLRAAGIEIVHADLKSAPGVDVAGDIRDPAVQARLGAGFGCVLIANMLEHVRDRAMIAGICEDLAGPSGLILATVPSSFPYHADPLDTGYRPSPQELAALFAGSEVVLAEEIEGETYRDQLARRGKSVTAALLRTALAALAFPFRPKSARARLSRWRWYRQPYRVALALVRVRAS
jgi:hypothetical protein